MKGETEKVGVYKGEERKRIVCLELPTERFLTITNSPNTANNVRHVYCSDVMCDV